jgi:hypothetical protein
VHFRGLDGARRVDVLLRRVRVTLGVRPLLQPEESLPALPLGVLGLDDLQSLPDPAVEPVADLGRFLEVGGVRVGDDASPLLRGQLGDRVVLLAGRRRGRRLTVGFRAGGVAVSRSTLLGGDGVASRFLLGAVLGEDVGESLGRVGCGRWAAGLGVQNALPWEMRTDAVRLVQAYSTRVESSTPEQFVLLKNGTLAEMRVVGIVVIAAEEAGC